jgi:hypothetical protein
VAEEAEQGGEKRVVKSAFALGAILLSGAALAASDSLSKVDTAKGEILLEVQGNGVAMRQILKISTACDLNITGNDKPDAEKKFKETKANFAKAFRDDGMPNAVLDFSAPPKINEDYRYAADAATAVAVEAAAAAAGAAAATEMVEEPEVYGASDRSVTTYRQRVAISVVSADQMLKARALFGEYGCEEDYQYVRRAQIELADVAGGKAAATTSAIAVAKAQAENYAAALNMRVLRIIRVSEVGAIKEFFGPEADIFIQEMRNDRFRDLPASNEMPVSATISVDFVLAPK